MASKASQKTWAVVIYAKDIPTLHISLPIIPRAGGAGYVRDLLP
jgi:hypothetical protein